MLLRYEVMVTPHNVSGVTKVLETNLTSVLVENLTPFTSYVAMVRYVNSVGAGPYGEELISTTAQGGTVTRFLLVTNSGFHAVNTTDTLPNL